MSSESRALYSNSYFWKIPFICFGFFKLVKTTWPFLTTYSGTSGAKSGTEMKKCNTFNSIYLKNRGQKYVRCWRKVRALKFFCIQSLSIDIKILGPSEVCNRNSTDGLNFRCSPGRKRSIKKADDLYLQKKCRLKFIYR